MARDLVALAVDVALVLGLDLDLRCNFDTQSC
jgi:hypothetical protein